LAAVTKGLQESRFDGAIAPFSFPLVARLQNPPLPLVALMQLNRHGGAIALNKKAWDAGVRTGADYANFDEFTANYRPYLQKQQKLVLGVEDLYSHWAYLYRYWLAEVGVDPERQLTLKAFAPSQLSDKLGSGEIQGYCSGEPWGQAAIAKKTGFLAYLSQDTWLGHPGAVLTTTAGWHKNHPNVAKALVAGILFGCQWCQQQTTSAAIAPDLSPADVLDLKTPDLLEPIFSHHYNYGGFDGNNRNFSRPDSILWYGAGQSLLEPDHANYPWRSHGIWMLTQMVRWQHLGLRNYPKDADKLINDTYAIDTYQEVAQAFKLKVPSTPEQTEASSQFIDQHGFDPSDPVAYINQFQIRS
jgi:nitrate/nitrite transport system substrate-binding protein